MKRFIGMQMAHIGAYLWEKGGFWNESESYEELTKTGKFGYNLFCKGLEMAGVTAEDIENIANAVL